MTSSASGGDSTFWFVCGVQRNNQKAISLKRLVNIQIQKLEAKVPSLADQYLAASDLERCYVSPSPKSHHPHTASPTNLLPPLCPNPQPPRHLRRLYPLPQQLLPACVEIPPGRRHLDRIAVIPQVVGDLAVGKGAPIGPELAPAAAVKAQGSLQQPDHRQLAQVIKRMASAPGEVAGDPVSQVPMGQRQGMGSGMGMDWPLSPWLRLRRMWLLMGPWAWPGRRCATAPSGIAARGWAPVTPRPVLGLGLRWNG